MTTTPGEPLLEAFHMSVLKEHDPQLYALVRQVRQHAMQDGAIPAKIKTLMALLCDAVRDRHEAARVLANVARAQGATDSEIAETLAVAYWIGGLHALNTGAEAFRQ
jgi:alkylhydroperoxidase/carboxymuconolactone decarboxylase family protein YurZ